MVLIDKSFDSKKEEPKMLQFLGGKELNVTLNIYLSEAKFINILTLVAKVLRVSVFFIPLGGQSSEVHEIAFTL